MAVFSRLARAMSRYPLLTTSTQAGINHSYNVESHRSWEFLENSILKHFGHISFKRPSHGRWRCDKSNDG
jgi:hypothetical protein